MSRRLFLMFNLFLPYSTCIYEYSPGDTYLKFASHLHYFQRVELMKIIFNTKNSRASALEKAQNWAHELSPLTEQSLDRAVFEHQRLVQNENRKFFEHAKELSDDAFQLGIKIRSILMNMDLSEFRTCQTISETIQQAPERAQKELGVEPINCNDVFERLRKVFDVIF